MAESKSVAKLERTLDGYLSGQSGIKFDVLARFAEPLLDLYELEPRSGLERGSEARSASELAMMLSVLETARLFWAFLLLDPAEADLHLPEFEARLLGDEASEEDRMDFIELIRVMQEQMEAMGESARRAAEVPEHPLPCFEELLDRYGLLHSSDATVAVSPRFGPNQLELPDALALFARPLLDDLGIEQDPDALEEALARANAYWDLAQAAPEEFDRLLYTIKRSFATNRAEADRIEAEARLMVARFHSLFPEQRRF